MTWSLLLLMAGAFVFLAVVGVTAAVLVVVLRRPQRRAYEPDDAPSPLEHAREAVSALTPAEWEEFRRWVEGRRHLPPAGGEGVTR